MDFLPLLCFFSVLYFLMLFMRVVSIFSRLISLVLSVVHITSLLHVTSFYVSQKKIIILMAWLDTMWYIMKTTLIL